MHREFKYFSTGNAVFEDSIPVLVLLPKSQDQWIYFSFFGLLQYMGSEATWITGGETDTSEAAAIFQNVYEGAKTMLFMVGMISDFAAALPDDSGWLQCDGGVYAQADFPDLFSAISTTYNTGGEGSGNFRVPDLRGRVRATLNSGLIILPSWADDPGGTGGESEHTLDVSETPSHTHTDTGHIHTDTAAGANATTIGPGAPQPTAVPVPLSPTSTGNANLTSTGGDGSHNNVQPTMALFTYILARF